MVECVYFRIKLNGLGHGRGWTEKTKQQAPAGEAAARRVRGLRRARCSEGLGSAAASPAPSACPRAEPRPAQFLPGGCSRFSVCLHTEYVQPEVTGRFSQGRPGWIALWHWLPYVLLPKTASPALETLLRPGVNQPSFPTSPDELPFCHLTDGEHTFSLIMVRYSRVPERVHRVKNQWRGTWAKTFEDCKSG